jgi:hypothetical protein
MYRLVRERSGYKCADEKWFIAKMRTGTVFRASGAGLRACREQPRSPGRSEHARDGGVLGES